MSDWVGNRNSVYKTLGASNHTDKEREKDDYYATDPIAIDKLLTVERPNENVWECACGAGIYPNGSKDTVITSFRRILSTEAIPIHTNY